MNMLIKNTLMQCEIKNDQLMSINQGIPSLERI